MSFDGLVLTVLAVLAGVFVGLARGGRFGNVVGLRVRAKGLLLIGVVVPAFADQFTREVAVPLVVGGLGALLAFAIVNVRIVGMSVMAVGILANLLPTFLNGGLPVSRDALVEAGLATRSEVDRVELRGARRLEEPTHRLRSLGDIIPLDETGQVLAFGDLVILVGLADIATNLTLRKRKRSRAIDLDDASVTDELVDVPVAVIDLVRLSQPRGGHQPRPRPLGPAEPELVAARIAGSELPSELVEHDWSSGSSPDVDWWPAVRVQPLLEVAPVLDVEPLEVAALVPELVEEPFQQPVAGLDDEVVDQPAAELHDEAVDDVAEPVDADEPTAEIDLRDAPWSTEPRWAQDHEPNRDSMSDAEPRWAADPEVELDAEPRWAEEPELETAVAPEPATIDVVDLRDPIQPGSPLATPAQVAVPAPAHVTDVADVADDEVFRLLFADLSKGRRHRRRGERTIPDFEPVHVDDPITLWGR
jgi:hypothetical protein